MTKLQIMSGRDVIEGSCIVHKYCVQLIMNDIFDVRLSAKAMKDLKKMPLPIILKLEAWIEDVGHRGLTKVRKIPGYHDEPLRGKRKGQRSIRLNIAYRAIYIINEAGLINFVEIQEVNKHEY